MQIPFFGKTKSFISVPPVSKAKTGKSFGNYDKSQRFHPIVSIQPIAERMARGCVGSMQRGEINTLSAPMASAVLKIEPMLKGERMSSA